MGIPYRGLGLITLVGTTHDTSLLYAATRGRRVKHPCPTLMHGGSTAHHQAGMTCHIALAVIRCLPVPHNQAAKALLLRRYPLRCVQRRDGGWCTHNSQPHRPAAPAPTTPSPSPPRCHNQSIHESPSRAAHHSVRGRAADGAPGHRTPSTRTLFRPSWIVFQALEDICPECRSAHLALGHPLSARSLHVPHSGAEAH